MRKGVGRDGCNGHERKGGDVSPFVYACAKDARGTRPPPQPQTDTHIVACRGEEERQLLKDLEPLLP